MPHRAGGGGHGVTSASGFAPLTLMPSSSTRMSPRCVFRDATVWRQARLRAGRARGGQAAREHDETWICPEFHPAPPSSSWCTCSPPLKSSRNVMPSPQMRGTPRVGSRRRRRSGRSSSLRQSQHRGRNDMGWPRGRRGSRRARPPPGRAARVSTPRVRASLGSATPEAGCPVPAASRPLRRFYEPGLATNFKGEQYNNRSLEGGAHF